MLTNYDRSVLTRSAIVEISKLFKSGIAILSENRSTLELTVGGDGFAYGDFNKAGMISLFNLPSHMALLSRDAILTKGVHLPSNANLELFDWLF